MTCRSAAFCATIAWFDWTGYLEIEGIDHVQHVALVNELVVGHPKLGDAPRHLRRHAGDLNAHAVPSRRPRLRDVVVPGHQRP